MPYRQLTTTATSILAESVVIAAATVYQIASALAAATADAAGLAGDWWGRISGTHGALFATSMAVIVLWGSTVMDRRERAKLDAQRDAKEDERRANEASERERRHIEAMAIQKESGALAAQMAVEATRARLENAIANKDMAKQFDRLATVIANSPCIATGAVREALAARLSTMPAPQPTETTTTTTTVTETTP